MAVEPTEIKVTTSDELNEASHLLRRIPPAGVSKDIIKQVKGFLDVMLKEREFDVDTVVYLTMRLMVYVKQFTKLSGDQKKNLVLFVINDAINHSETLSANPVLRETVRSVVPGAIDLLVDVSKGRYKFKIKKWFSCC